MPRPPENPFDRLISSLQDGLDLFFDDLQSTAEDFLISMNRQATNRVRHQVRMATGQVQGRPLRPPIQPKAQSHPPHQANAPKPSKQEKTAYDYLEVSPHASPETIVAAFQSLGRRFHPDNRGTGDAEKFKLISAAYTILKDPQRRKKYDRTIGVK